MHISSRVAGAWYGSRERGWQNVCTGLVTLWCMETLLEE
ncbi:hypothetical protein M3J09_002174 [Ascochyta lentis]